MSRCSFCGNKHYFFLNVSAQKETKKTPCKRHTACPFSNCKNLIHIFLFNLTLSQNHVLCTFGPLFCFTITVIKIFIFLKYLGSLIFCRGLFNLRTAKKQKKKKLFGIPFFFSFGWRKEN